MPGPWSEDRVILNAPIFNVKRCADPFPGNAIGGAQAAVKMLYFIPESRRHIGIAGWNVDRVYLYMIGKDQECLDFAVGVRNKTGTGLIRLKNRSLRFSSHCADVFNHSVGSRHFSG